MNALSGEVSLTKMFRLPSEKGVCSKRKEFAPMGSKFFPFRVDAFSEGLSLQEFKQEDTKVVSLVQNGREKLPSASLSLKSNDLKI